MGNLVQLGGEIVWYHPERKFGFIHPDGAEQDVWFHRNDLMIPHVQGDQIVWEPPRTPRTGGTPDTIIEPHRGASVMFLQASGKDGRPKASPWAYYRDVQEAEWQLEEQRMTSLKEKYPEVYVVWNGGYDTYLVDPASVRDMTPAELAHHAEGNAQYWPIFRNDDGSWIRGNFLQSSRTQELISVSENQCVRTIRRLARGD